MPRRVPVSRQSDVKGLASHRLLPRCRGASGPIRKVIAVSGSTGASTRSHSQPAFMLLFMCNYRAEQGMNRYEQAISNYHCQLHHGVLAHAAPPAELVNGRPAHKRIGGATILTVNVCGVLWLVKISGIAVAC